MQFDQESILNKIEDVLELTKDFNKLVHLYSQDDGIRSLANMRAALLHIKAGYSIFKAKKVGFPAGRPFKPCAGHKNGEMVAVRPCGERFGDKTFLGYLLGELALSSSIKIEDDSLICEWSFFNPAIFIPETGDIVMGCESWWKTIKSLEDMKQITDLDVNSTWYVVALKALENSNS